MTQDPTELFRRRVDEHEVAEVLEMIHGARNLRNRPLPGDLPGEFDHWFDGGAVKVVTGCTEYFFRNGVHARIPVLHILCVWIHFPDGRSVTIEQEETGG